MTTKKIAPVARQLRPARRGQSGIGGPEQLLEQGRPVRQPEEEDGREDAVDESRLHLDEARVGEVDRQPAEHDDQRP